MAIDLEGVTLLILADIEGPVQGWQMCATNIDDRSMYLLDIPQGGGTWLGAGRKTKVPGHLSPLPDGAWAEARCGIDW